jgi:hypothetical protein
MIEPGTIVRHSDRATFRKLEDGSAVILHLDSTQYHGVNEVGAAIWELTEQPRSFANVVAALRAQLDEEPRDLEGDVEEFLLSLLERGLIAFDGEAEGDAASASPAEA